MVTLIQLKLMVPLMREGAHHHCCWYSPTATSHRQHVLVETSVAKVGVGRTIELRTLLEFSTLTVQGVSWKQVHGLENCHSSLIQVLGIEPQVR